MFTFKKIVFLCLIVLASAKGLQTKNDLSDYEKIAQTGDLIFQTNFDTPAAYALHVGTLSKYNHVGVVVEESGRLYVYEALRYVTKTPLDKYVGRKGTAERFTVTRLDTTEEQKAKIKAYVKSKKGDDYDPYLSWSDDGLYCSELAFKAYLSAGIEIFEPEKLEDNPLAVIVANNMKHNFIVSKVTMNEKVVSPADLSRVWRMDTVFTNY
tara:strand:- start:33 stop:662 length:630 start_codon:yes stop_codon:yes gene_type:complete